MPRIAWIDEEDATGEVAAAYEDWLRHNPGRDAMPGILKAFSQRPEALRKIIELTYPLHFCDGHLTRRIKEMIATYVSGLNRCPY